MKSKVGACYTFRMDRSTVNRDMKFAVAAFFVIAAILPALAHAQTPPSDLRATIRAELLSDPRSAALSQTQLNAMVELLAQQAQAQGITASDITWRPQTFSQNAAASAPPESCTGNFTCVMDEAFGFIGPDLVIPFSLGLGAMGLIWIIAEMLHRRHHPHLYTGTPPASGM